MIPGIEIDLGGTTFIVPPLSLGSLEVYQDKLAGWTGGIDPNSVSTALDVSLAALKRNYPSLTREQLGEMIDLGNMGDVMLAVADAGGLRRKALDEEKAKASNPAIGHKSSAT